MAGESRVSNLSAQLVSQSSGGNQSRLTGMVVQTVVSGRSQSGRVSNLTAQTIESGTPKAARTSNLIAQVISQSLAASGNVFRVGQDAAQVIYTIGAPDTETQRAWTFDFDGHTFYVLDLGTEGALVFDLTTKAWSRWDTAGYEGHFNMKNGFHWRDGKMVVGGGLLDGLLVRLEEESYLDEDFRPVSYEIQGVIFSTTERYLRNFNLRLVGSPGRRGLDDDVDPPVLSMQYSDDNGANWSNTRNVTLTNDTNQRIEFRSLGAFRQPGRIFRLFDSGGVKFVAYVMADVEGEQ